MSSGTLPSESRPVWNNWSENIKHEPPSDGSNYYFAPKTLSELKAIVAKATAAGIHVRVSGQRHSQAPLVALDNTANVPTAPTDYLIDMSCYADLGANGDQNITVDAANKQVTVNTGVREDVLDATLTQNNLMMRTVTAGGFFSIGGMTSVDVHGATIDSPIFSGTVSSFTILKADGSIVTIDENTAPVNGWNPIQFARVNLGGLGVVTSVTLDVLDRPFANSLQGGTESFDASSKSDFVSKFQSLLTGHDRVETFYNPYFQWPFTNEYTAAYWDVVSTPSPQIPNAAPTATSACALAAAGDYGAGFIPGAGIAEKAAMAAQDSKIGASLIMIGGIKTIEHQVDAANKNHSDLWLSAAARVMFMSYFIELPAIDAAGLGKAYDSLQVVGARMRKGSPFYISAPMEFRFITGGDTAMAGTYSTTPGSVFINLDLIGFVDAVPSSGYPTELLQFFADVEREWVAMGGFPHNGKMYGFYDPTAAAGTHTPAFNPNFLDALRTRRGARLTAYNDYRESMDPNGTFLNGYLKDMLGA